MWTNTYDTDLQARSGAIRASDDKQKTKLTKMALEAELEKQRLANQGGVQQVEAHGAVQKSLGVGDVNQAHVGVLNATAANQRESTLQDKFKFNVDKKFLEPSRIQQLESLRINNVKGAAQAGLTRSEVAGDVDVLTRFGPGSDADVQRGRSLADTLLQQEKDKLNKNTDTAPAPATAVDPPAPAPAPKVETALDYDVDTPRPFDDTTLGGALRNDLRQWGRTGRKTRERGDYPGGSVY